MQPSARRMLPGWCWRDTICWISSCFIVILPTADNGFVFILFQELPIFIRRIRFSLGQNESWLNVTKATYFKYYIQFYTLHKLNIYHRMIIHIHTKHLSIVLESLWGKAESKPKDALWLLYEWSVFQYDMLDKGIKTATNVKFNSLVQALYKISTAEFGEQFG